LPLRLYRPAKQLQQFRERQRCTYKSGTRIVWNVYPQERCILVWTSGEAGALNVLTLQEHDTLNGGDVLPDFTLAIAKLFERLPEKMD